METLIERIESLLNGYLGAADGSQAPMHAARLELSIPIGIRLQRAEQGDAPADAATLAQVSVQLLSELVGFKRFGDSAWKSLHHKLLAQAGELRRLLQRADVVTERVYRDYAEGALALAWDACREDPLSAEAGWTEAAFARDAQVLAMRLQTAAQPQPPQRLELELVTEPTDLHKLPPHARGKIYLILGEDQPPLAKT